MQVLSPRVQHTEEADAGAEVRRIGRHLQQRFGAGAEQQVVKHLLVLQHKAGEVMREREDQVEIRNRKQVLHPVRKPLVTLVGLAFRAMSVSARIVRDGLTAASRTPVQMAAESCRAAVPDGPQHFQLRPCRDDPGVGSMKRLPAERMMSATSRVGRFISSFWSRSAERFPVRSPACPQSDWQQPAGGAATSAGR